METEKVIQSQKPFEAPSLDSGIESCGQMDQGDPSQIENLDPIVTSDVHQPEKIRDSFTNSCAAKVSNEIKTEANSDISDEGSFVPDSNIVNNRSSNFEGGGLKKKFFKPDSELAKDIKDYKKRHPKSQMGRDCRRRYQNQSRRGRFYGERRRPDIPQYQVIPSQVPPLMATVQDTDVPPPDPVVLQAIESDPPGIVRIADGMKEVRFYGESAIVMIDWDDPRDISFQAGSRRVIIDDLEIITLPFNAPYTSYTLYNGRTINIRLGAPTRDLFIDGRFFDARFGGPPIEVPIDGVYHRIQLGGPLPHMCLGSKKRTDLVAGRITMIVDEQTSNVVYLDSKPQKFEINGTPFIIKFDETLTAANINGKRFRIEFGGIPIHISCFGIVHTLRFSSLPPGTVPGYVNFIELDFQTTFDPYTKAHIFDALSLAQPSTPQDFHNYHYHYHYHCTSQDTTQIAFPNLLQAKELIPTVEYKVLLDPPSMDTKGIDVKELFQKLVETGIVPAAKDEKVERPSNNYSVNSELSVDFMKPETLKQRNLKEILDLQRGNQCDSCGMRFIHRDTSYINHLRYHVEDRKPNEICSRRWWCHFSEFLVEFDEDLPSWFKRNGKFNVFTDESDSSLISVGGCSENDTIISNSMCICCNDNFSDLPNELKKECCVTNIENDIENISTLEISSVSENIVNVTELSTLDTSITNFDDSQPVEIINDNGLIDITSDEELEPGEIVEGQNDIETDILEIVEIKPKIEIVELSDDEIEEGEIIDGPEPIPLMDIDFSKIKIKSEKFDENFFNSTSHQTERWSIDGNSEYVSANLVKPKKIKVNIPSIASRYHKRRDNRRRARKRQEAQRKREIPPRPASVKPKIANSIQSVNICKSKGRETSALCSVM